jgi:hypothetical protein
MESFRFHKSILAAKSLFHAKLKTGTHTVDHCLSIHLREKASIKKNPILYAKRQQSESARKGKGMRQLKVAYIDKKDATTHTHMRTHTHVRPAWMGFGAIIFFF